MNGRRARKAMLNQLRHGLRRKYRRLTASHETAVRVAADSVAQDALRTMAWFERWRFWWTGHLPERMAPPARPDEPPTYLPRTETEIQLDRAGGDIHIKPRYFW